MMAYQVRKHGYKVLLETIFPNLQIFSLACELGPERYKYAYGR
jgi:hypothetical protein